MEKFLIGKDKRLFFSKIVNFIYYNHYCVIFIVKVFHYPKFNKINFFLSFYDIDDDIFLTMKMYRKFKIDMKSNDKQQTQ